MTQRTSDRAAPLDHPASRDRRPVRRGVRRPARRRALAVLAAAPLVLLAACSDGEPDADARTPSSSSGSAAASPGAASPTDLGAGFLAFPDAATQWAQTHADDPLAPAVEDALVGQPTALWLTGDESFGNLDEAVERARAADRTMLLVLYDVPLRWDGLSDPSTVTLDDYERWVDRVVSTIGDTRAVVVLEPDALWFQDRLPDDADRAERMRALGYAVDAVAEGAPRTRLYLEAGTSSGSVTPERMAELLVQAGVQEAAGFAVNVSSYAPTASIQSYAQDIRSALQDLGVADPRYVVDTGRNGAPSWDNDWCNPVGQRLGEVPAVLDRADGLDMHLWVKAPGTSDGDCGPAGAGQGTYGGEFVPQLAADLLGEPTDG